MNVLRNQIRNIPNIVGNLLQNKHVIRTYAFLKPLPVNWVRPEKISCIDPRKSGDGGLELNISPDDPIKDFDISEELKTADDIVKKMFSVGFSRRNELIKVQRRKAVDLVKRHNHDVESMESKIARATAQILQLQEHQQKHRKNSKTKVILKELIEKRKKWLKKLRIHDYPRFEYLLEKLNLTYHPFPEENPYIQRKAHTRKLLQKFCDEMIQKKLDSYRKELEAQQKDFFKAKAEKLEFIRNEEIALGVEPTIREEEIEAAKKKAATFV